MSKVKDALICDICHGTGEVFSPLAQTANCHIRCPFCHGRGFYAESPDDDSDSDCPF